MRALHINNKLFIAIIAALGAVTILGVSWFISQRSATALTETTYSTIDLSDPWTATRGLASGGYEAATNSLTQSVDSTVDPENTTNQTEVLAKTIPDSSSVEAKVTIDPSWESKPVRVGLWGEVYSSADPSVESGYPIIEFASTDDGTKPGGDSDYVGFRVYDTRGGATPKWYNLTDVPFVWGQTYKLKIAYNPANEHYDFSVDDSVVLSLPASRSNNDDSPRDTFRSILFATYNSVTGDDADNYSATWTDAAYGVTAEMPDSILTNAGDSQPVTLTLPAGATLTASSTVAADADYPDSAAYHYPVGLVNFSFTTSNTDNLVTLVFVTDLTPQQVSARKYDPTTHTYSTIEDASITETTYSGQHALRLSYNVVDNGSLDLDPATGTISDPVGLAAATAPGAPNTGYARTSVLPIVAIAMSSIILLIAALTLVRRKNR